MKNFIIALKTTDKRFWLGIPLMGGGLGLMLIGAYRDGINDLARAIVEDTEKNENKENN